MPTTDKHTPDSALRALRRIGVRPDERDSSLYVLPYRGPGIKGWGVIDYLKRRGVRFRRAQ